MDKHNQTSPSLFTQIINREVPAHRVWENDDFISILDTCPTQPGHLLVIPKYEVDYIFALPDSLYTALWKHVRFLSGPLRDVTNAPRIAIVVEGFGVPHVHVHLVPVFTTGDLEPSELSEEREEELTKMAEKIRKAIELQRGNR